MPTRRIPGYITYAQAARMIGVTARTLHRWRCDPDHPIHNMEARDPFGRLRIRHDLLEKALEGRKEAHVEA